MRLASGAPVVPPLAAPVYTATNGYEEGNARYMRPLLLKVFMSVCFWAVILGKAATAQSSAGMNPFDTPDGLLQGSALFQTHCTYCHGARGQGGRGSDLTTGQYKYGGTDAGLYATIRNGVRGTEMPSVRATDEEVWKLVTFVKRLGTLVPAEKAPGDASAGKLIFEGKGGCMACHSVDLAGGTLGPDLSDVGRRRDLDYLKESLLKPEADVALRYRAIQIMTRDGQAVTGIRLNEDDISIQVRDEHDNLRSFLKENIREARRDRPALMPAYGARLSAKEIDDVISYLSTLRSVQ